LFLSDVLLMALAAHRSSPAFRIETVQVEGVKRLTQGDINTVLGIIDESIFLVSPQEMEENLLKAFPDLISAQFKISLPAELSVNILEREPVLSLIYKGVEYWVDSEGVAFTPRGNPGKLIRIEAQVTCVINQPEEDDDNPGTLNLTVDPQL
jgi:cell division septal protein FtsQ